MNHTYIHTYITLSWWLWDSRQNICVCRYPRGPGAGSAKWQWPWCASAAHPRGPPSRRRLPTRHDLRDSQVAGTQSVPECGVHPCRQTPRQVLWGGCVLLHSSQVGFDFLGKNHPGSADHRPWRVPAVSVLHISPLLNSSPHHVIAWCC